MVEGDVIWVGWVGEREGRTRARWAECGRQGREELTLPRSTTGHGEADCQAPRISSGPTSRWPLSQVPKFPVPACVPSWLPFPSSCPSPCAVMSARKGTKRSQCVFRALAESSPRYHSPQPPTTAASFPSPLTALPRVPALAACHSSKAPSVSVRLTPQGSSPGPPLGPLHSGPHPCLQLSQP